MTENEEKFVIHRLNQHSPEDLMHTHARLLHWKNVYEQIGRKDKLDMVSDMIILTEAYIRKAGF